MDQSNPTPPTPQSSGWKPEETPASTQPQASSPFESNSSMPNLTGPANSSSDDSGPVMMEPAGPKSNLWLYILLAVLVIGGLIFLASWFNWFGLGSIFSQSQNQQPTQEQTPAVVANVNDATRKTDLANLKTSLQQYFNTKQSYPVSSTLTKTSDPDTPLKVLVPDYISSLPVDPLSPNYYYGYRSVDGKSFELSARLEDETDASGAKVGDVFLYIVSNSSSETPVTSNPAPAITDPTSSTTPSTTTTTTEEVRVIETAPSTTIKSESSTSSSSGSSDSSASASATAN